MRFRAELIVPVLEAERLPHDEFEIETACQGHGFANEIGQLRAVFNRIHGRDDFTIYCIRAAVALMSSRCWGEGLSPIEPWRVRFPSCPDLWQNIAPPAEPPLWRKAEVKNEVDVLRADFPFLI